MEETEQTPDPNKGSEENKLVLVSELLPVQLVIIPLFQRPLFPGMTIPLLLSGEKIIKAISILAESDQPVAGVVMAREIAADQVELYEVGTAVKILKIHQVSPDSFQVLVHGVQRFRKSKQHSKEPVIHWTVDYLLTPDSDHDSEIKAFTLAIISSVKDLLKLNPMFQEQLKLLVSQFSLEKPGLVMDLIASMTTVDAYKLQDILETLDLLERAQKLLMVLKEEIEVARLQEKIKQQIEEKITRQQREYFLYEQLKAIKQELGLEKDEKSAETDRIQAKIAKLKLTEEAAKVVAEEIEKLRLLEPASAEYHVVRNYLDWLTDLPWGTFSKDRLNIRRARAILDEQHYGLQDVKERILEFISTIIRKGKISGSIICLVGPPGVGKTSIGRSIADALNRQFYRFSIGGMRDEAEIKGHRRTYIGALPGKLIQSLKRAGTANPVIMLDEIDKIGASYQGDPASALLEVLDPEQNRDFLDHYLDVRFDLSNVLFVTTANTLDTVPAPLLDRMEIINLSGYILEEKLEIARRHLIPKQLKEHGLKKSDLHLSDEVLKLIIDRYAREAGVRSMEMHLRKIMRKVTMEQVEGNRKSKRITPANLEKYLGKPVFMTEELYQRDIAGVVLGLAWTSMGGSTLYIEATAVPGSTGLKLTGHLGEVMQESASIAYSLVRSKAEKWGLDAGFFEKNMIHLHVPAGATPKDGPSAGITMTLAMVSLIKGKPVSRSLAMTGEITLTGKVLPIGGLKEKTIAARRVGVFHLIFPVDNRKDFEALPEAIRQGIQPVFADYFEDVLAACGF